MSETSLIVDLTNFKDRVGSRVDPGRYLVQVEDAEITKAKSGNTMVNLFLRVMQGEHEGATIVDRLVMSQNSLFRVVGFMQAIGIPTPKKRLKIDLARFIGRTLLIDVDDGEPYNGRVNSEVRGYIRVAKGEGAEESTDLADLEDGDGAEDEEETSPEPAKKKKDAKKGKAETSDDDDDDQFDDSDMEDIDLEEIDL